MPCKHRTACAGPPARGTTIDTSGAPATSAQPNVAGCLAGAAHDTRNLIRVIALDRLDAPVRQDVLDDPNVMVAEEDEIARLRANAGAVRDRAPGLLSPVPDVADVPEALTLVAER